MVFTAAACDAPPPSIVGRWVGKLNDVQVADAESEEGAASEQLKDVKFEYVFHADGSMRMQTRTPHTETVTRATWREAPGENGWRIIEILPRGHKVVTGRLKIRFLSADAFELESDLKGRRTSTFTRQGALEFDRES